MRMRTVLPILVTLIAGTAYFPAVACELHQAASHPTVTALLVDHGATAQATPIPRLAACKGDGAPCTADADCCSNLCRPIAEGRACVAK